MTFRVRALQAQTPDALETLLNAAVPSTDQLVAAAFTRCASDWWLWVVTDDVATVTISGTVPVSGTVAVSTVAGTVNTNDGRPATLQVHLL